MPVRKYSVHLLIQEEAEDMNKREIFPAVPSLGTISFVSDGETPKEVARYLRQLLEGTAFRAEQIHWVKFPEDP